MLNRKKKSQETQRRQVRNDLPARNNVFSYHTVQNQQEGKAGEKYARRRRQSYLRRWSNIKDLNFNGKIAVFILIAVSLVLVVELRLSSVPNVVILGSNNPLHSLYLETPSQYAIAAQKYFNESIGNSTKLTINTRKIATALENKFPQILNVSVTVPLIGNKATVYIDPADPVFVANINGGYFLIGNNGRILNSISQIKNIKLPVLTYSSASNLSIGYNLLSQDDINFIELVIDQFKIAKIPVKSFNLLPASRELDVQPDNTKYFIKFNLQDNSSANQQIGSYLATRNYFSLHNINPTQYVDVRVPGRVFYK